MKVLRWALAESVQSSPQFKSLATPINSQLVCLQPDGTLDSVKFAINTSLLLRVKL